MDGESARTALEVAGLGAVFGGAVTVLLGHLESGLTRRRKGLGAARLIRWELHENQGFVTDVRQHGMTFTTPIHGRTDLWLAHGDKLAEVANMATLEDVLMAYSIVGQFNNLLFEVRSGRTEPGPLTDEDGLHLVAVQEAIYAIEPYCLRWPRSAFRRRKNRPKLKQLKEQESRTDAIGENPTPETREPRDPTNSSP